MLATFHTHSLFCDGYGYPEDYVLEALNKGFKAIGISSHAPVAFETDWTMKQDDFQKYLKTVLELKNSYADKIQVYLGLETDYYIGCCDWRKVSEIDYTIGAVHFLYSDTLDRYMPLDGTLEEFTETLELVYNGNIHSLVTDYYRQICMMTEKMPPDIIAHLDIIKKNNKNGIFFDETQDWYREAVLTALESIKKSGCIVEVNTGGIARGYTTEMYPSDWILEKILDLKIPIVLNSDAHIPSAIDAYYSKAIRKIKSIGFTCQRVLYDGKWCDVNI